MKSITATEAYLTRLKNKKQAEQMTGVFYFSTICCEARLCIPALLLLLLLLERSHCPQCRQLYKYVKAASVTGRGVSTEC